MTFAALGRSSRVNSIAAGLVAALALGGGASAVQGQSTEERFQDLFVTAGYCTAFGAALGTAFLAWTDNPTENLRYVAVGASLGFIGGSILGTYVIFSPMVTDNRAPAEPTLLSSGPIAPRGLTLRPVWNRDASRLQALESGWTVAQF